MNNWELTVGLEVHIQLSTNTKMFCQCISRYGEEPNSLTCPICLAMPGSLPTINQEAIDMAVKLSHALNFDVNNNTSFSRKNYYYPDLPKGYQITQFNDPICKNGKLEIEDKDKKYTIGITRAHLEEDSGKLIHHSDNCSFVDLNRAGSPLIEIVSEPEIHSSEHAKLYLEKLKQIIKYINISDCDMEKGNLRVDINVSVKKEGDLKLGTRREVKNLNSFKSVQKAIEYEYEKQIELIESGHKIEQSTLTWDEKNNITKVIRKKEDAHDYRYFPEPDLPALEIFDQDLEKIKSELPELPNDKLTRFRKEYNIKEQDLHILVSDFQLADYFEDLVKKTSLPQATANWILVEILYYLNSNNTSINDFPISQENLADLIKLYSDNKLTNINAKKLFNYLLESSSSTNDLIKEHNLMVVDDDNLINLAIEGLFEENPNEFERLKNGESKLIGFFMGQAMKSLKGNANPKIIQEILKKYIGK